MVPQVPTEIVEAVVDYLHDDKPTLSACALVSWAWVPRSRFRLFRTLTYHTPSDGSGFAPFLNFLQSSPGLGTLIHDLTLDGLIEIDSLGPEFRDHEAISHSTLIDILDTLPALSDFTLRHVWFTRPHTWTKEEHQRFEAGTMRDLALRRLTLHSIGHLENVRQLPRTTLFELHSLLTVFSSVQELRVSSLPVLFFVRARPTITLRNPLYGQTQPWSLVLHDPHCPRRFWDIIRRISSPVTSLSVKGYTLRRVRELNDTGAGLRHLSLNCMDGDVYSNEHSVRANLDLSICAALTSFMVWAEAGSSTFWENISSLLPNLPLGVQRLKIYLCLVANADGPPFLQVTENLGWEEMRRVLDRLSCLKELVFIIQHLEPNIRIPTAFDREMFDDGMKIVLERELSLLRGQGILSVSSSVVDYFGPQI